MEKISINTEKIQLDQFLKWAGILESGGQVRPMLDEGLIFVNGVKVKKLSEYIYSYSYNDIKTFFNKLFNLDTSSVILAVSVSSTTFTI